MKIAIISDVHDNLANLNIFFRYCEEAGVTELICLGDVTTAETLEKLAQGIKGRIHLVRGNADMYETNLAGSWPNIVYYGKTGSAEFGGFMAGMCHEPENIPDIDNSLGCDLVFYGHTHKPWIGKQKGLLTANPGTLSGVFQQATFALWQPAGQKLELKYLHQS
jgi:hypothetical protein